MKVSPRQCLASPGIPKAAEETRIDRNIRLAEMTGAHIHLQHVTTAEGVNIIRPRQGKKASVSPGETAPHYFTLTDDAVRSFK